MSRLLLTTLIIAAVFTARCVLKLPLYPYRAARGLLQGLFTPA